MSLSEDNPIRKQAEDILLKSEGGLRLVLDSASEAICGCDSEGTCLFSNVSAARILGYDGPAELVGRNLHALEHHTRKDGTPYPIEECPIYIGFQKNEDVHSDDEVYWRKDGTSFPVEFWSHLIIRDGRTLGAVITFLDITERKEAEEALRKSEERWRSVYANSAIGVALTDLNGRFLAVNRPYEKMLGYTEEELRKLTFLDITEEDYRDSNSELISELLEGKRQQFQIEKQYRRKDGTLRWVSNNVSLVPGTESMPRFIMALSEDITDRKQAEAALRKSEEPHLASDQQCHHHESDTAGAPAFHFRGLASSHLIRPMRNYPLPAGERFFPFPRRRGRTAVGLLSDGAGVQPQRDLHQLGVRPSATSRAPRS
jgi:PAS domain S-box-containing protein